MSARRVGRDRPGESGGDSGGDSGAGRDRDSAGTVQAATPIQDGLA